MVDAAGTTVYTYPSGGFLCMGSGPFGSDTAMSIYTNRLRVGLGLPQPVAECGRPRLQQATTTRRPRKIARAGTSAECARPRALRATNFRAREQTTSLPVFPRRSARDGRTPRNNDIVI